MSFLQSQELELVWYRVLRGHEQRADMVACGVKALEAGADGPALRELAAADELPLDDLRALFRRAAGELGIALPDAEQSRRWCILVADRLERAHPDLPARSTIERVDENLWVLLEDLSPVAESCDNPALSAFVQHFAQYGTGGIDDYSAWLHTLCALRDAVSSQPIDQIAKRKVEGIADLIADFSFGAITETHAERSLAIRQLGTSHD